MFKPTDFHQILRENTANGPVSVDDLLKASNHDAPKAPSYVSASHVPSGQLWSRAEGGDNHIGIRIKEPIQNSEMLAAKFAALAIERKIVPVFLSHTENCEMQRHGFRVERVMGNSNRELQTCEDQLVAFWDIAIVIDVADVKNLG